LRKSCGLTRDPSGLDEPRAVVGTCRNTVNLAPSFSGDMRQLGAVPSSAYCRTSMAHLDTGHGCLRQCCGTWSRRPSGRPRTWATASGTAADTAAAREWTLRRTYAHEDASNFLLPPMPSISHPAVLVCGPTAIIVEQTLLMPGVLLDLSIFVYLGSTR
jgi:hypothetical protein